MVLFAAALTYTAWTTLKKLITKKFLKKQAYHPILRGLSDQLNKFEDNTGIPARVILSALATGTINARTIPTAVESYIKVGTSRFTMRSQTQDLFDEFVEQRDDFPYKKTYKKLFWYRNANQRRYPITFENKIYFETVPNQKDPIGLRDMFHEYVHVLQYRKYGLRVFTLVYVGDFLFNLIFKPRTDAYMEINFEEEAFEWEQEFLDWLKANWLFSASKNRWIRKFVKKRKKLKL